MYAIKFLSAVIVLNALIALGCTGSFTTIDNNDNSGASPDAGSGDAATAPTSFTTKAFPAIKATCDGSGCHTAVTPRMIGADAQASYPLVMAAKNDTFPNFATTGVKLIDYGTTGHKGTTYSAQQKQDVIDWLNEEAGR